MCWVDPEDEAEADVVDGCDGERWDVCVRGKVGCGTYGPGTGKSGLDQPVDDHSGLSGLARANAHGQTKPTDHLPPSGSSPGMCDYMPFSSHSRHADILAISLSAELSTLHLRPTSSS